MQARSPESQGVRCDACLPGAKLKEFRRDLADAHALLTRSLALRPPYPLQGSAECHKKVHFRPPLSCRTECILVDGTVVVGREPFSGLCVIGLPLPQPISCSADEVRVGFGYSLSFRAFDDGTNFEVWGHPGRVSCFASSTEGLRMPVRDCFCILHLLASPGQGMWEDEIAVVLLP